MTSVPNIQQNPKQWFDFFDQDRNGFLTKDELINALIHTFHTYDIDSVTSFVNNIWTLFDSQNHGYITYETFVAPDGLLETITSSLPSQQQRSNNNSTTNDSHLTSNHANDLPPSYASMYPAQTPISSTTASTVNNITTPVKIQVKCGSCTFVFEAVCPPGHRQFDVRCVMCETLNRAVLPAHIATPPPVAATTSTTTGVGRVVNVLPPPNSGISSLAYSTTDTITRRPPQRRALFIGINYFGTRAELRGCINDTKTMKRLLCEQYGWSNDDSHMRTLTDDPHNSYSSRSSPSSRPTKANMMESFRWLVKDVIKGDVLFLLYSGHGAQQSDPNGYEEDGMNECILPVDFQKAGMITDDEMAGVLVHNLPDGVRLTAVMDCCHSGTGLDLPYEWIPHERRWREETNPFHSRGDVQMFSGCTDDGVSSDGGASMYTAPGGAMTTAFYNVLRENPCPSYPQLLERLHYYLRQQGYKQKPIMSSSQPFALDRPFLIDDILPNMNPSSVLTGHRIVRHKFPPRPNPTYAMDDRLGSMLSLGAGVMGGLLLADILFS